MANFTYINLLNKTLELYLKEEYEKDQCDIHYYCITKDMTGVYSIAEMIDSVHNRNKKTVVHVIPDGFKDNQIKSFKAVLNLINQRGGITFLSNDLNLSVELLNALQYM